MPEFIVVTAFKSKDQMSADLKAMGLNAKNFGQIAGLAFSKAKVSALGFRSVLSGILAAGVVQRGLGLLRQGLGTLAEEALHFDSAITGAAAAFGIYDRQSEAFAGLAQTAREVGKTTEYTAVQGAEGLRFLAKAGWDVATSMKALPTLVNLATASEETFEAAAVKAVDAAIDSC